MSTTDLLYLTNISLFKRMYRLIKNTDKMMRKRNLDLFAYYLNARSKLPTIIIPNSDFLTDSFDIDVYATYFKNMQSPFDTVLLYTDANSNVYHVFFSIKLETQIPPKMSEVRSNVITQTNNFIIKGNVLPNYKNIVDGNVIVITNYEKNTSANYIGEVFLDIEILSKFFEHTFSPTSITHIKESEVDKFVETENINKYKLPQIIESDIISRYLNAKAGDIIMTENNSFSNISNVYYRLVVKETRKI